MRRRRCFAASLCGAQAQDAPATTPDPPVFALDIRYDHWSEADERDYGRFIAELGDSGCDTVDRCLHDARNPFRGTDPPTFYFRSDCAKFPYALRFYFAWKRGLPFSYESAVEPRGAGGDLRYSFRGNSVSGRTELKSGTQSGYTILEDIENAVFSASYRIHPDLEEPYEADHYSPAIDPKSIRPGTVIYDPNGHLATVWRVDSDGRIHYLNSHPDNSVTRGFYDLRFVRAFPGMGAGFKNWRPQRLVGAVKQADGTYFGGHIELAANKDIADFSDVQFFGNGPRPAKTTTIGRRGFLSSTGRSSIITTSCAPRWRAARSPSIRSKKSRIWWIRTAPICITASMPSISPSIRG